MAGGGAVSDLSPGPVYLGRQHVDLHRWMVRSRRTVTEAKGRRSEWGYRTGEAAGEQEVAPLS